MKNKEKEFSESLKSKLMEEVSQDQNTAFKLKLMKELKQTKELKERTTSFLTS